MSVSWHDKVCWIGTQLKEVGQEAEVKLEHIFEPGVYIREMIIPHETYFIGRPHRFGHRVQFISGRGMLHTDTGSTLVQPPWEIFTRPGWITVLHTDDQMVLRTIHPNPDNCRDVELMESLLFHPAEEMRAVSGRIQDKLLEHFA